MQKPDEIQLRDYEDGRRAGRREEREHYRPLVEAARAVVDSATDPITGYRGQPSAAAVDALAAALEGLKE